MEEVGSLEEAARKRKERLLSLKRKQTNVENPQDDVEEPLPKTKVADDDNAEEVSSSVTKKDAIFKNYVPEDENLQEKVQPNTELAQVEDHIKDQLDASKPAPVVEEIDLNNIAPRKPDWDLKRDVAKKQAKLEKRTQRAIAELIRERLQSGEGDPVAAVEASSEAARDDSD